MKSIILLFDGVFDLIEERYKKIYKNMVSGTIHETFGLDIECVRYSSEFNSEIATYGLSVLSSLRKFHEPAFLITNKPIAQGDIEFVHSPGMADPKHKVGYISTYSLPQDDPALVSTISIHEIGHIMGLKHHVKIDKNGKFCFMRQKTDDLSWEEIRDENSPYPCKKCQKRLGTYVSPMRKFFQNVVS